MVLSLPTLFLHFYTFHSYIQSYSLLNLFIIACIIIAATNLLVRLCWVFYMLLIQFFSKVSVYGNKCVHTTACPFGFYKIEVCRCVVRGEVIVVHTYMYVCQFVLLITV